jgi:hypothetical protein
MGLRTFAKEGAQILCRGEQVSTSGFSHLLLDPSEDVFLLFPSLAPFLCVEHVLTALLHISSPPVSRLATCKNT